MSDDDKVRRKVLSINRSLIRAILDKDHETVFRFDNLPDDYEIVSVNSDPKYDGLSLIIESGDFDPIEPYFELPHILPVICQRVIHEESRDIAEAIYEELFSTERTDDRADLIEDMTEVIKDVQLNDGDVKDD